MKTASPLSAMNDALLSNNLQRIYQDLGLDPLVNNLDLDHPTMRVLTEATQASAASSLMALHNGSTLLQDQASKASVNGSTAPRKRSISEMQSATPPAASLCAFPSEGSCTQRVKTEPAGFSTLIPSPRALLSDRLHQLGDQVVSSNMCISNGALASGTKATGSRYSMSMTGLQPLDKDKNKGLRQFSLRVCRQVEAKSVTTYNQVADELVNEFRKEDISTGSMSCDEKNIRRRAYDALNVLTAMEIISKDKKNIRWNGFAHGDVSLTSKSNAPNERDELLAQIRLKKMEILEKEAHVGGLSLLLVGLRQLLRRNGGVAHAKPCASRHKIYLPFVLVKTDDQNAIECQMSGDKRAADLSCERPFELFDDKEVLNMMEIFSCDETEFDILPPNVVHYAKKHRQELAHRSATRGAVDSDPESETADSRD